MKKWVFRLSLLLLCGPAAAQTDYGGNPVFNSVSVKTVPLGDSVILLANYYTLAHNIENKKSSVFISDHPTPAEAAGAALSLPSSHYVLTRRDSVVALLILRRQKDNDSAFEIGIIHPGSGASEIEKIKLSGAIPELRATELLRNRYDSSAVIRNGYIRFDRKNYRIIPDAEIEAAVRRIIRDKALATEPAAPMLVLPKERMYALFRELSVKGGAFDFWKDITVQNGHDGIQVEKGVFAQRIHAASYQWGKAAAGNGIESEEDAVLMLKSIRPATYSRELEYMKIGFRKAYNYE